MSQQVYSLRKVLPEQSIGVPEAKMGELVCARIQVKDGESLTEDDVNSFCQGQITHFKVPTHIRFVDDYPMKVTGKIQKFKMSEFMVEQLSRAA